MNRKIVFAVLMMGFLLPIYFSYGIPETTNIEYSEPKNLKASTEGVIEYNFNDSVDRVFGLAAGNYTFNFSLTIEKGYNIRFACEAFSPNWDFNMTLELWDPVNRYYHILERKFSKAYGFPFDEPFETLYGTPKNGTYVLLASLEVFTSLSVHLIAKKGEKVINEFYPESGVVGEVFEDYRVYNESVNVHEYVIHFDSDTEYSFNFVRVSPMSEAVMETYYNNEFPSAFGTLNIGTLSFDLWDNITTGGNREQNEDFKVTIGSFENNTVSFKLELVKIYTNMVFLFISHSTKRIGDGPDAPPPQPPSNETIDDTIDKFFEDATEKVKTTVFNDSFLLGTIIVLLIGGIIIAIKSQTAIFEVE